MDQYHAAPAETAWRVPSPLTPAKKRMLLVADDDIASAHAMGLVLSDAGYLVDFAHTGLDALFLWPCHAVTQTAICCLYHLIDTQSCWRVQPGIDRLRPMPDGDEGTDRQQASRAAPRITEAWMQLQGARLNRYGCRGTEIRVRSEEVRDQSKSEQRVRDRSSCQERVKNFCLI